VSSEPARTRRCADNIEAHGLSRRQSSKTAIVCIITASGWKQPTSALVRSMLVILRCGAHQDPPLVSHKKFGHDLFRQEPIRSAVEIRSVEIFPMKMKFALVALAVLGGAAISIGTASAMPIALMNQSTIANVETIALVCGPRGCVRTRPAYRRGVVVVRRPYVRRHYRRY